MIEVTPYRVLDVGAAKLALRSPIARLHADLDRVYPHLPETTDGGFADVRVSLLHVSRLRLRGYDQTLELARPLARRLGLPLVTGLRRVRATAAQSELDAATRRRNLRNAFVAAGSLPAHVALVDDVMTTGATLQAAARALRRAGVERVDAWVCARVP